MYEIGKKRLKMKNNNKIKNQCNRHIGVEYDNMKDKKNCSTFVSITNSKC